jgi:IS605 OrfB family transposase
MNRTVKLRLGYDERLVGTIKCYNEACNYILKKAFKAKTFNKLKVHHLTYKKIRKKFPRLQSSLVCAARDQACDMLRRERLKRLPTKKPCSGIRYNARTFTPKLEKGVVSISTIRGRLKFPVDIPVYFKRYVGWHIAGATLSYKNAQIFLHLNAKSESPFAVEPNNILGIDRGVTNPVVTSNGQFFNSREIRRVKGKYQWLKGRLQSKGTRSAKRHLKRLSGRENRFVWDVNHCLSKRVVESDADTFALEDLKIKRTRTNGRRFNRLLGSWSFGQFQRFLAYKAEALGKNVVFVNPKHTSQKCSVCGHVERGNRHGSAFKCKKCGFSLNADLNAARNIAQLGKALLDRRPVNPPIVACIEHSYKPPNLLGGS